MSGIKNLPAFTVKGNVLLVEDDIACATYLAEFMKKNGINMDICTTGAQAIKAIDKRYNLVILDMQLPDMSGMDVLNHLAEPDKCPAIVMWSGACTLNEQIAAWQSGFIMDLIEKPTNANLLLARIQNRILTSRGMSVKNYEIKIGAIKLDLRRKIIYVNDNKLELSPKEYTLLEYLIQHSDSIIEKSIIMNYLYSQEPEMPNMKILDVITCKLRGKIEHFDSDRSYIETQWARGYLIPSEPKIYIHSQLMALFMVSVTAVVQFALNRGRFPTTWRFIDIADKVYKSAAIVDKISKPISTLAKVEKVYKPSLTAQKILKAAAMYEEMGLQNSSSTTSLNQVLTR